MLLARLVKNHGSAEASSAGAFRRRKRNFKKRQRGRQAFQPLARALALRVSVYIWPISPNTNLKR